MSEYEYYSNSPYVNFCKAEGYQDRQDKETQRFRNLAYITHASMVPKPQNITQIWPMWLDKVSVTRAPMTPEQLENIIKIHGLNKDKFK